MRCGTSTADNWPRRCPATTRLDTALQHHSGAGVLRHGPMQTRCECAGSFSSIVHPCISDADTEAAQAAEVSDRGRRKDPKPNPTLRTLSIGVRNILMQHALMTLPLRLGIHRLAIDGECCSGASGLSAFEKHRRRQQPPHQPAARPQGGCRHDPELRIRDRQRLGWCRAVGGCNSGTGQRTHRKQAHSNARPCQSAEALLLRCSLLMCHCSAPQPRNT